MADLKVQDATEALNYLYNIAKLYVPTEDDWEIWSQKKGAIDEILRRLFFIWALPECSETSDDPFLQRFRQYLKNEKKRDLFHSVTLDNLDPDLDDLDHWNIILVCLKNIIEKEKYVPPSSLVEIFRQLYSLKLFYDVASTAIPESDAKFIEPELVGPISGENFACLLLKIEHALSLLFFNAGCIINEVLKTGQREGDRNRKSNRIKRKNKSILKEMVLDQYNSIPSKMKRRLKFRSAAARYIWKYLKDKEVCGMTERKIRTYLEEEGLP